MTYKIVFNKKSAVDSAIMIKLTVNWRSLQDQPIYKLQLGWKISNCYTSSSSMENFLHTGKPWLCLASSFAGCRRCCGLTILDGFKKFILLTNQLQLWIVCFLAHLSKNTHWGRVFHFISQRRKQVLTGGRHLKRWDKRDFKLWMICHKRDAMCQFRKHFKVLMGIYSFVRCLIVFVTSLQSWRRRRRRC